MCGPASELVTVPLGLVAGMGMGIPFQTDRASRTRVGSIFASGD